MTDDEKMGDQNEMKQQQSQSQKERLMFLTLCSEQDKAYLSGEQAMSVEDFKRISYVLETIGFTSYLLDFYAKNRDMMKRYSIQILDDLRNDSQEKQQQEQSTMKAWLTDFCDQLPSKEIQAYVRVLANLDKE